MSLKVVFMGTPEMARVSLEEVLRAGHQVRAGVCQPDRKAGRGRKLTAPPVKDACRDWAVPVIQPETAKTPEFLAQLKEIEPDVLVTVAFGQILPQAVLDVPKLMPINLHFSLLPELRGAGPVNWAIINGLARTGVSTIRMTAGLDAGPVLLARATEIGRTETAGELAERLSRLGAEVLIETLSGLEAGGIVERPQDGSRATLAPMLGPRDGILDFSHEARLVQARGRGVTPWPGAKVGYGEKLLKVYDLDYEDSAHQAQPGEVISAGPEGFRVGCGQGSLLIGRVQHPGKKPLAAIQAVNGAGPKVGEILG